MTQRRQSQTHHKFPQAAMMPHSTQKHTRTQTYACAVCAVWFIVLMFVQGSDLSFLKPCLSHGRTSWWQKSSAIKRAKVWKRLQSCQCGPSFDEPSITELYCFFFHGPQDNRIFEYFFVQFFAELQRIFRFDDRPRDRRKVSVSCLKLGVASGDGELEGDGLRVHW